MAYLRGIDQKIHSDNVIFEDSLGLQLGENLGKPFIEQEIGNVYPFQQARNTAFDEAASVMAVRSLKIDDLIMSITTNENIEQIVLLAAGLDTRAWRLNLETTNRIQFFECDYDDIF